MKNKIKHEVKKKFFITAVFANRVYVTNYADHALSVIDAQTLILRT